MIFPAMISPAMISPATGLRSPRSVQGLAFLVVIGLVVLTLVVGTPQVFAADKKSRPNIVFILADDLGFSDIAPYGSEVRTPALSELAAQGVRFSNYHTAANCAPARAMLLTGVNNHLAGVANIPEMIAPEQAQHESYKGVLGRNVVTVATLLESAGYHTYMAGKWHLGATPELLPSQRGFQRTVALMDSGADNWEQRPYIPIYEDANWFADGERYRLPDDFYSSKFLIDKTIEFIDSNISDGQPFFAYVPFQAVHIPVQAPSELIEANMGVYDAGWEVLRQQRGAQAVKLGLVPEDTQLVDMPSTADWDDLSAERKRYESKRMAVYAAMIEAMDQNIGRLIAHLKQQGIYDNTIFIFTSDNGAEVSGADDPLKFPDSRIASGGGYHTDYERLGQKGSFSSISPSFASAAVSPLAYYKFHTGEGGMRVPLIISAPGRSDFSAQQDSISPAFAWATDITPTILSLADVDAPGGRFGGRDVIPMSGKDLVPILNGSQSRVYARSESVGYELTDHAALFQGDYKLVRVMPPRGDGEWHLYNLLVDPGEASDLKTIEADRFEQMQASYAQFKTDHGVQPLPAGYSQTGQMMQNYLARQLRDNLLVVLLALLVFLPFLVAYRMRSK